MSLEIVVKWWSWL